MLNIEVCVIFYFHLFIYLFIFMSDLYDWNFLHKIRATCLLVKHIGYVIQK